jgi:hypothetical protein
VFVVVEFWPTVPHLHDGSRPDQVLDVYERMGFRLFLLDTGEPVPASRAEVLGSKPGGGHINLGLAQPLSPWRRLTARLSSPARSLPRRAS